MGTEEWAVLIALGSMAAAWFGAVWAYRTQKASQEQLRIAQVQEERREAPITLTISASFSQEGRTASRRLYAFNVLVTNQSEIPNSIVRAELLIDYEVSGGEVMTAVFPRERDIVLEEGTELKTPLSLGARESAAGWVFFDVDGELRTQHRIRGHRVAVTDSHGSQVERREILVREILAPRVEEEEK